MESCSNVKPLTIRFVFSGKPPQVDTTSSVNAPLHGHKRMMHTYTRRKKAPSPVGSSSTQKPPSGPVDPPPLFFPFHRGGAMESSNVKPLKVRFVFSGKPPQVDAAAAASSAPIHCSLCPNITSSVNARHGHKRMHPYTKRKEAPSVPVASSTQKPSGPVDPPPRLPSLVSSWSRTAMRTHRVAIETSFKVSGSGPPTGPVGHLEVDTDTPVEEDVVEERKEGDAVEVEPRTREISMDAGVGLEDTATPEQCGQSSGRWGSLSCRKERKEGDLEEVQRSSGLVIGGGLAMAYACRACGKSFPSYQAVCGHMASHGRHNPKEQSSPVLQGGQGGEGAAVSSMGSSKALKRRGVKAGPEEHRCNLCGREFPTGQALGGHMRLHWKGPKTPPLPLPLPPPPPAAAGSGPMESESRRIYDFDLNELPMVQALCGHATSHGRHNPKEISSPVLQGGQGGEGAAVSSTESSKALKRRRVKASPAELRCNLCGRVFLTGQALGGHKRLHWEGPKIRPLRFPPPAPLAAAAVVPTPEAMENEQPMDEDGDGGIPQEILLLR